MKTNSEWANGPMGQKKLKTMAQELAKGIKKTEDLTALSAHLTKMTVEADLMREFDHL